MTDDDPRRTSDRLEPTGDRTGIESRQTPGPSSWWIVAVLFAVPYALSVEIASGVDRSSSVKLPLADAVLWIVAGWFGLKAIFVLIGAESRQEWWKGTVSSLVGRVAPEAVILVAVAALSIATVRFAAGAAELVQIFDYYVIWWLLVRSWARRDGVVATLPFVLLAWLVALELAVLVQWWRGVPSHLLTSLFSNRGAFLAAVLVIAPPAWATSVGRGPLLRWMGHVIVAAGIWLAAGSLVTVAFGLIVLLLVARWISSGPRLSLELAATALLLSFFLPTGYRDHLVAESKSLTTVAMAERRRQVIDVKKRMEPPVPTSHFSVGSYNVFVGTDAMAWAEPYSPGTLRRGGPQTRVVPEYYAESWSAMRELADVSFFGNGLGTWRETVGRSFGILPRTGTSFPWTANGYLVVAVTMGWLGLVTWMALTLRAFRGARRLCLGDGVAHPLAIGCFAALVTGAIVMFVQPIMMQSLAVVWVIPAALATVTRFGRGDVR